MADRPREDNALKHYQELGKAAQDLANLEQKQNKVRNNSADTFDKDNRRRAINTMQTNQQVLDNLAKGSIEASKEVNREFLAGLREMSKQGQAIASEYTQNMSKYQEDFEEKQEEVVKRYANTRKLIPHFQSFFGGPKVPGAGQGGIGSALEASIENISSKLLTLTPAIASIAVASAAMGALAAIIAKVVEKLFALDKIKTQFIKGVEGDTEVWNRLVGIQTKVTDATNLNQEAVLDLASSFKEAGISLRDTDSDLQGFLTQAGIVKQVLNTSDADLANYIRSFQQYGNTAENTGEIFNNFFQIMNQGGMSINDLNDALKEGNDLWRQYGGTAGLSLDQTQKQTLEIRGIFKALNVDLHSVKDTMTGIMGDPKKQMREAAFVANRLHISAAQALSAIQFDPEQAAKNRMYAGMDYYTKLKGTQADLNNADIRKLSDSQQIGIGRSRQMALQRIASQSGMSPEVMQQLISDRTGYLKEHKNASILDWMQGRADAMAKGNKGATLTDTFNSSQSTLTSLGQKANNLMDNMVTTITQSVAPNLDNLVKFFTGKSGAKESPNPAPTNVGTSNSTTSGPLPFDPIGGMIAQGKQAVPAGNNTVQGVKFSQAGAIGGNTNNRMLQLMDFYVKNGLAPAQAAGIVGNFMMEGATLKGNRNEIGGGGGYGLAQWTTNSRKAGLKHYANTKGLPFSDEGLQAMYSVQEMKDSKLWDKLQNIKDPKLASRYIMQNYERPLDHATGGRNDQNRAHAAEKALKMYEQMIQKLDKIAEHTGATKEATEKVAQGNRVPPGSAKNAALRGAANSQVV